MGTCLSPDIDRRLSAIERAVAQPALTELVHWREAITDKPDADVSVAIWFTAPDGHADWERGWWDGEAWRLCESGGVVDGVVLFWADLQGPQP